jgi:hypothetical protein
MIAAGIAMSLPIAASGTRIGCGQAGGERDAAAIPSAAPSSEPNGGDPEVF